MSLGATPFSIYLTSAPDQVAYVIQDAGARVAIVEAPFAKLVEPLVEHVLIAGEWDEEPGFEPDWRAVEPDDLLTLIYTSGTTGPPKGVQITHGNMMAAVVRRRAARQVPGGLARDLVAAVGARRRADRPPLPADRVRDVASPCCPDPRRIGEWLPKVKPTWFFAVPRVWEKLKAGIEAKLAGDEGAQKLLAAGRQKVELEQAGQPIPDQLAPVLAVGEEKLFAPLRAAIGLDEVKVANVGAAPIPRDVLVFFHAIGVPLAEIWGMSETCGAGASNPLERIKIGTVGPALAGRRAQARRRRRAAGALEGRDGRLPQPARPHRRSARRRRLAAHRRRGHDRRGRLRRRSSTARRS